MTHLPEPIVHLDAASGHYRWVCARCGDRVSYALRSDCLGCEFGWAHDDQPIPVLDPLEADRGEG